MAALTGDPWLVFVDADVRLAPDALVRMVTFMKRTGVALASGVPRQEVRTLSEQLLVPLIHFVSARFLTFSSMRWTRRPAFSAGCGQLFIARAGAYAVVGGHAAIRSSLHDGIKLPRLFRQAGFRTDLFDGTDLACCRMYRTDAETWKGLAKNAVEGLAAPGVILPMTTLLLGGQVAPLVLLIAGYARSPGALVGPHRRLPSELAPARDCGRAFSPAVVERGGASARDRGAVRHSMVGSRTQPSRPRAGMERPQLCEWQACGWSNGSLLVIVDAAWRAVDLALPRRSCWIGITGRGE